MLDLTIVLSDVTKDDKGQSYPISHVFRYDFQGTIDDLRQLIDANPHLFIEGGPLKAQD